MQDFDVTVYFHFEAIGFDPKNGMNYQEMSLLSYYLGSLTIMHMKPDGKIMSLSCQTSRKTAAQWLENDNWQRIDKEFTGRWKLKEVTADMGSCAIL